jgi:hypothetical protein
LRERLDAIEERLGANGADVKSALALPQCHATETTPATEWTPAP